MHHLGPGVPEYFEISFRVVHLVGDNGVLVQETDLVEILDRRLPILLPEPPGGVGLLGGVDVNERIMSLRPLLQGLELLGAVGEILVGAGDNPCSLGLSQAGDIVVEAFRRFPGPVENAGVVVPVLASHCHDHLGACLHVGPHDVIDMVLVVVAVMDHGRRDAVIDVVEPGLDIRDILG